MNSNKQAKSKDEARKIFTEYLKRKGHRKTPERYAILDKVYSHEGHFDIESLYIFMKNKNYRVSRATLYNTIELLLDCKLVVKHQFGKTMAQYEKAYNIEQHDHIICTACGKVEEINNSELQLYINNHTIPDFEISHYSLYVYGVCNGCKQQ